LNLRLLTHRQHQSTADVVASLTRRFITALNGSEEMVRPTKRAFLLKHIDKVLLLPKVEVIKWCFQLKYAEDRFTLFTLVENHSDQSLILYATSRPSCLYAELKGFFSFRIVMGDRQGPPDPTYASYTSLSTQLSARDPPAVSKSTINWSIRAHKR
jgi:hypothetical protein